MKNHKIDLSDIVPHGKAELKLSGKELKFRTTHSVLSCLFNYYDNDRIKHYISLPGEYRLPFRLNMKVKLDAPALLLLAGGGHISFSTPWQDNRKIDDIAFPSNKPNMDENLFNNSLPYDEYNDISVIWNLDEFQISINGQERFYSRKMPYMSRKNKNKLEAVNADGFEIKLSVFKHAQACIKAITIMEFDENAQPIQRAPVKSGKLAEAVIQQTAENKKPSFEDLIKKLPKDFSDEVINMDSFFKSLRPLKFNRTIDKNGGKISYTASDFGISYAVNISGSESSQNFGWYVVCSGKPETWHQKADHMEELLNEIEKTNKELAHRIFYSISDCAGCFYNCLCEIPYKFNGQKRSACHGRVILRMRNEDFKDAREFFSRLNQLMERKIAQGNHSLEKIFLKKKQSSNKNST